MDVRTWIEIDAKALRHNAEQFLRLIPEGTRFMAVIKSNAYGHGLVQIAKILEAGIMNHEAETKEESNILISDSGFPTPDSRLWFGVDSITEALRLRREGIQRPIFVLGHTLPLRLKEAAAQNIALTISSFENLNALAALSAVPEFHLKIDTGMHRQGFLREDISKLLNVLKSSRLAPRGIYTHFAEAKDPDNPDFTLRQIAAFRGAVEELRKGGFENLIFHAAASGGTLLFPEAHFDMVRVGMGLYGYPPSAEIKNQISKIKIALKPVLTWKTVISEVKEIPAGSGVGYDLTEKVGRRSKIAVLPIGYWHGYDRGLSGCGEALIRGRRAKALGRISMDMTVVDVTDIPAARVGDEVVLLGAQENGAITAEEVAEKIGTTHYEMLTRINPLIRRIVV